MCPRCKASMRGMKTTAIFCSVACKQAAYRERVKDRRNHRILRKYAPQLLPHGVSRGPSRTHVSDRSGAPKRRNARAAARAR